MAESERSLAIFIDFENLALGFQGRRERFDIARVLERLVEKGKIVAKKSYADWSRFSQFTFALHEAAIELIEIPRRAQSGKNSADIRLCVDAMDLAYSKEHINTFVILSGDSDFSPLVSKLKELGKHVIGLGMQQSTSELLRDNCDEFIYYEDLGQHQQLEPTVSSHLPEQKRKAFELLMESLVALRRENKDVLWSSMIKDTIKRKKPSFNETYHGYRTFSELLEDAQREGLLELETDKRSRTYVVTRFGAEMHAEGQPAQEIGGVEHAAPSATPAPLPGGPPAGNGGEGIPLPGRKKSRRRRRGRGSREGALGGVANGSTPHQGGPVPVQDFQPVVIPPGPAATGAGIVVVAPSSTHPPASPEPAPPPAAERPTAATGFAAGLDTDEPPAREPEPKAKAKPAPTAPPAAEVKAPATVPEGEPESEKAPEAKPAKTTKRGTRTTRTGTAKPAGTTRKRATKAAPKEEKKAE